MAINKICANTNISNMIFPCPHVRRKRKKTFERFKKVYRDSKGFKIANQKESNFFITVPQPVFHGEHIWD